MAETIAETITLVKDVSQQQGLDDDTVLDYINSFYQNQFFLDMGMKPTTIVTGKHLKQG